MSSGCDVTVALAGNPNVGKSTLFNVLTGETAHVGNWPGVTVELKEGIREHRGSKICFVDLPGTYGISATSMEEVIAREFIISGQPDIVAVLVDSTAPERTIYLAVQIMELVPNVLIVLTKYDEAHAKGVHIHVDKLEEYLGVPVVPVSDITGEGIRELKGVELAASIVGEPSRTEGITISYYGRLRMGIRCFQRPMHESASIREVSAMEKAMKSYFRLKEAILGILAQKTDGLTNAELADLLDIRSDYQGSQKDYLSWSVLGLLLNKGKVVRKGRRYFLASAIEGGSL